MLTSEETECLDANQMHGGHWRSLRQATAAFEIGESQPKSVWLLHLAAALPICLVLAT